MEVLKSIIATGDLTLEEVIDLFYVAQNSDTITDRTKFMLEYLYRQFADRNFNGGKTLMFGSDRQQYAAGILCDFMKLKEGQSAFPNFSRDKVGVELLIRVANPGVIYQGQAGICGPVSFLYNIALDNPAMYAKYGIDLYETGRGRLRRIEVAPSHGCRTYSPPADSGIGQADWMTAASLRDSENFLLDYDSVGRNWVSVGTSNSDVTNWFSRAGYTDIRSDDNLVYGRSAADIGFFNEFYNKGYRIVFPDQFRNVVRGQAKQHDLPW
jgi:hypothetical protein